VVKRNTSERLQKSMNSFQKFLNGRTRVLSCKTYYFCPFQKFETWRFKIIKDEDSRRKAVLAAHPCRPRRGTRILVRPLLRSLALKHRPCPPVLCETPASDPSIHLKAKREQETQRFCLTESWLCVKIGLRRTPPTSQIICCV